MDSVVVSTSIEDFLVRVRPNGARPENEQVALARWAASQFRLGIAMNDPGVVRGARQLVRLLDGDALGLALGFASDFDDRGPLDTSFGGVAARLERELLARRLIVERPRVASLTERRDTTVVDLPPLPPARRESGTHSFEVRFVDEIGKAISGMDAEFIADGAQTRGTNAAGVALLEGVPSSSANVSILDPDALSKVLDPRWESFRPGKPPKESNTREVVFRGAELGPFDLKAELPNTIVIKPPLGKLFVALSDKSGRARHANREFSITGPRAFEGTTDAEGCLLFEEVFPGDYELELTLKFFEGDPDEVVEQVSTQLLVLDPGAIEPQVRRLAAVPRSILARLRRSFNTNKAFLLPTALSAMQKLRRLYTQNTPCQLLVVGHADTQAKAPQNDPLSLQRAEATLAYLKDDVDAWLAFYSLDDARQRWGKVEDHLMIIALADFASKPKGQDEIKWFQRTRGLTVDGTAGPKTRAALIHEYMSLDGTSLSDFVGEIEAVAHGAGENFPLDETETELDPAPTDEQRDPGDRRVELFFFDPDFGITPKPGSANSGPGALEYPKWLERVVETVELEEGDPDLAAVTFIELTDAHFRTNSAVVLPEGEAPDESGDHQAIGSVGIVARALRFNDEHSARTILVAGHTDTTSQIAFNQKLSEERAEVALCMLKGGSAARERFAALCDARHTVADIKQILSFATKSLGFDCDPGVINDVPNESAVRKFQTAFNANKTTINSTAANLTTDGKVGHLTWGAFFDCYEFVLGQELGETPEAVEQLRKKLVFTDPEHEFLGFSEHFPIEELGVDQFRSQSNRRAEILFFEPGEQPDIPHAADDPATSELYLPGRYERVGLSAGGSALRNSLVLEWPDSLTEGLPPELTLVLRIGDADPVARLFKDGVAPIWRTDLAA
jgi:outer membrane protein OmpA-like peptidoglycan-associated protein